MRLHYLSWGSPSGIPVVLLHGLRSYAQTWQSLADALGAPYCCYALDQRGLRPLHDNRPADLFVSADLRLETRLRQVREDYDSGYYGGYNRYGPGYGMYNTVPVVRTYQEQVVVVRVDLFDARNGQPVWSASAETPQGGRPGDNTDAIREAVEKAMSAYPPS